MGDTGQHSSGDRRRPAKSGNSLTQTACRFAVIRKSSYRSHFCADFPTDEV